MGLLDGATSGFMTGADWREGRDDRKRRRKIEAERLEWDREDRKHTLSERDHAKAERARTEKRRNEEEQFWRDLANGDGGNEDARPAPNAEAAPTDQQVNPAAPPQIAPGNQTPTIPTDPSAPINPRLPSANTPATPGVAADQANKELSELFQSKITEGQRRITAPPAEAPYEGPPNQSEGRKQAYDRRIAPPDEKTDPMLRDAPPFEEWQAMSRKEREAAGLPVSEAGGQWAYRNRDGTWPFSGPPSVPKIPVDLSQAEASPIDAQQVPDELAYQPEGPLRDASRPSADPRTGRPLPVPAGQPVPAPTSEPVDTRADPRTGRSIAVPAPAPAPSPAPQEMTKSLRDLNAGLAVDPRLDADTRRIAAEKVRAFDLAAERSMAVSNPSAQPAPPSPSTQPASPAPSAQPAAEQTSEGTPTPSLQLAVETAPEPKSKGPRSLVGEGMPVKTTDKQATAAAKRFVEGYHETEAEKVRKFYLSRGEPEKAKAYSQWIKDEDVSKAMAYWGEAVHAATIGDDKRFVEAVSKAYNAKGYYDDGYSIVPEASGITRDENGTITGAQMTWRDDATGQISVKEFDGSEDLYRLGASLLSPEQVFDIGWERVQAADKIRDGVAAALAKQSIGGGDTAADKVLDVIKKLSDANDNFAFLTLDEQVAEAIRFMRGEIGASSGDDVPVARRQ